MRHLSIITMATLLIACGAEVQAPSDALTVSIDSSGGVPVITVSGEPPTWTLDSLGVIGAETDQGFAEIRSIALDPRGGVWVADVGENRLTRWSDDGAFIEELGRVGSGPGEFRTPYSVAIHDGALLVLDIDNSRIVRFELGTKSDTSWLIPSRVTGTATDARLFPDPAGPRILDFVREPEPTVVFVRATDFTDRVTQPPSAPSTDVKVCPFSNGIRFFSAPFAPRPVRTPWRDVTVATADGDYRIERFDRAGRQLSTLSRPVDRDSITQAEFEAETADWRTFDAEHPGLACTGEIVRYEFKPAIRRLLPSDDGRLWVEQALPGGGFRFEVWSGDSLIGAMSAPSRLEEVPPAMLGDRLAVVAESPDGAHVVRLYRVAPPSPSR